LLVDGLALLPGRLKVGDLHLRNDARKRFADSNNVGLDFYTLKISRGTLQAKRQRVLSPRSWGLNYAPKAKLGPIRQNGARQHWAIVAFF
jgi:hypothetical protein